MLRPHLLASHAPPLAGALAALLLQGCLVHPSPSAPLAKDTPFTIGSVSFPDTAATARALGEPSRDARLRRFLEKCAIGKTVRVGFIGGSITMGAGSTAPTRRYSSRFTDYLRRACPAARVEEINAGIPSTTSRFAASRVAGDVLSKSPDLIVVEFSVNDLGNGEDAVIREIYEGLIRRCLTASDAAVMLLLLSTSELETRQDVHAQVGAHYGLAMVRLRDAIRPLLEAGRLAPDDLFSDRLHPNDAGHRLAAHFLRRALARAQESPPAADTLPPPATRDLFVSAGAMTSGDSAVTAEAGGWERSRGPGGRSSWTAPADRAATLVLRTRRREMTLGIRTRPDDTSSVRVSVDGGPAFVLPNAHPASYVREVRVLDPDAGTPGAEREVRVTHAGGPRFKIEYVLHAGVP